MHSLIKTGETFGRGCVGVSMVAFGIQHVVYGDFVTRVVPKLPIWIPGRSMWACAFGLTLVLGGLAVVVSSKSARATSLLLAATFLASFLVCYLPLLAVAPRDVGLWVNAGKALALSGCAFLVANTLPGKSNHPDLGSPAIINLLEKLLPLGSFFLGLFFAFCGVLHFFYVKSVADLVPAWIPAHVFWTYFAGVALVAGGVGMQLPSTARLAAGLSALMIFLWVLLLHIPRAASNFRDSNETTAVFEALAIAGAALLAAISRPRAAFESVAETNPKLNPCHLPTNAEPQGAGTQNRWVPAAPQDGTCS